MPCNVELKDLEFHDCLDNRETWTEKEEYNYVWYGEKPCYIGRRLTPYELGIEEVYRDDKEK